MRARLATTAAVVTTLVLGASAVVASRLTTVRLRSEVDASLRTEAQRLATRVDAALQARSDGDIATAASSALRGAEGSRVTYQLFDDAGKVLASNGANHPIDPADVRVAQHAGRTILRSIDVNGQRSRLAIAPVSDGLAIEVLRGIEDIDNTERHLWLDFAGLTATGALVAILLAWSGARRALQPAAELARAAHDVAERSDTGMTVPEQGGAELAQLGAAINTMLRALDSSRRQQQRLIDDAAHELRTPLTSMRTNIELLVEDRLMDPEDRAALLVDIRSQLEEFTALVADLGELSRSERTAAPFVTVALRDVITSAVTRAQRRATSSIEVSMHAPAAVNGSPALLERALVNVLDNAVKFSPTDASVRVVVDGAVIDVEDDGPGIAAADLPFVFERFWRSPEARATQGSGLGLSIVRDIVDRHHGTVSIHQRDGGGTTVRITLPDHDSKDAPIPSRTL